jgi:hypothetical protein
MKAQGRWAIQSRAGLLSTQSSRDRILEGDPKKYLSSIKLGLFLPPAGPFLFALFGFMEDNVGEKKIISSLEEIS